MISPDVTLGERVAVPQPDLVNLYGCCVGDDTKIGPFVEIQRGVSVGARCKVSSHAFLCEGVTIEDEVFVGHGVMFTNDRFPCAARAGTMLEDGDWELMHTLVRKGASIGSGATVLPGITVGREAMVGAGAVVVDDVPDYAVVVGCPAHIVGDVRTRDVE